MQLHVHIVQGGEEVADLLIETGHAEKGGNLGLAQLLPALLGADAETALGAGHDDGRVADLQRLEHLTGKGAETGVVENVQLAALKFHGNQGRGDGIAALDLLGVKVTDRIAVGDLTQPLAALGSV